MPNRFFWILLTVATVFFTVVLLGLQSIGLEDSLFFSAKTVARAAGVIGVVLVVVGFIMRSVWPLTDRSPILGWTVYMILVGLCSTFMQFLMFGDTASLPTTKEAIFRAAWFPLTGVLFGTWMRRWQVKTREGNGRAARAR